MSDRLPGSGRVTGGSASIIERLVEPRGARPQWSSDGYLDTLGQEADRPSGLANAAMHFPALAAVYQRIWRPTFTLAFDIGGRGTRKAHERLLQQIAPLGAGLALDVGCGPGLYTPTLASDLTDGVAIGVDVSAPMLRRAVRDNSAGRVGYVRGNAEDLPFRSATFDAVICLAALYLIPNPEVAVREMCRVLAPGGEVAIFTSALTPITSLPGSRLLQRLGGFRVFDEVEVVDWLRDSGMEAIEQQTIGQGQFIRARKTRGMPRGR